MHKLAGRLFFVLLALSTFAAILVGALWLCSLRQAEILTWRFATSLPADQVRTTTYKFEWIDGTILFTRETIDQLLPLSEAETQNARPLGFWYTVDSNNRSLFGTTASWDPPIGPSTANSSPVGRLLISTYAGFPFAFFLLLPVSYLYWRFVCHPELEEGRCLCGYDIRGSPERCPECGLEFPK